MKYFKIFFISSLIFITGFWIWDEFRQINNQELIEELEQPIMDYMQELYPIEDEPVTIMIEQPRPSEMKVPKEMIGDEKIISDTLLGVVQIQELIIEIRDTIYLEGDIKTDDIIIDNRIHSYGDGDQHSPSIQSVQPSTSIISEIKELITYLLGILNSIFGLVLLGRKVFKKEPKTVSN